MKILKSVWNGIKLVSITVLGSLAALLVTSLLVAGIIVVVVVATVVSPLVWAGKSIKRLFSSKSAEEYQKEEAAKIRLRLKAIEKDALKSLGKANDLLKNKVLQFSKKTQEAYS